MTRRIRVLGLLAVSALLAFSASVSVAQTRKVTIAVYGDSLTSGYQLQPGQDFATMLERKLLSSGYQVKVLNMSVTGATTADGVARLPELLAASPDIVILALGMNDALRGLDVNKVVAPNLHQMLHLMRNKKDMGVLMCGIKAPETAGKPYGRQFATMYYKMAHEFRTSLYPYLLKDVDSRADLNLADGFHPNENGVLMMVQNMYPEVEKLVKWRIRYLAAREH